jgi:hypothetical protein
VKLSGELYIEQVQPETRGLTITDG